MADYKTELLLGRIEHELKSFAFRSPAAGSQEFIKVGRTAYELGRRHGQHACLYAARLALAALDDGEMEEAAFWKDVAQQLICREGEDSKSTADTK